MQGKPDIGPDHQALRRKLKESFAPIYLTALSVIQGVALADLGSVTRDGYPNYTITNWLQVVLGFVMLVIVWSA